MANNPEMVSSLTLSRSPLRGRQLTILAVVACILSVLYAILHCGPSFFPRFARREFGAPADASQVMTKVDTTVDKISDFVGKMEESMANLKESMAKRDKAMLAVLKGDSVEASDVYSGASGGDPDKDCELSMKESLNFFCDSDEEWKLRKMRFVDQQTRQNSSASDRRPMQDFWQNNYEPNFSCTFERRVGQAGDGGKWVCDPWRIRQLATNSTSKCLVYSIGSNNQFGFENGIHKELPECEIHTFDHTVKVPRPPSYVHFHSIGLAGADRQKDKVLSLGTIMKNLGHDKDNYFVEILKIDIEANEYDALLPILEKGQFTGVRQLQIELHPPRNNVLYQKIHRFFELMYGDSWVIFHKEANLISHGTCVEFSLMKLDWNSPGLVAASSK